MVGQAQTFEETGQVKTEDKKTSTANEQDMHMKYEKILLFFSSFAGLGDLIKTDDIMKADNYNQNQIYNAI